MEVSLLIGYVRLEFYTSRGGGKKFTAHWIAQARTQEAEAEASASSINQKVFCLFWPLKPSCQGTTGEIGDTIWSRGCHVVMTRMVTCRCG
jgi:hypothetical protein